MVMLLSHNAVLRYDAVFVRTVTLLVQISELLTIFRFSKTVEHQ